MAPLPGTIADFWKMVLDSGSNTIVMLTPFKEGGKIKAHSYWPSQEYTIRDVTLSFKSKEVIFEGLTKRVIEVSSGKLNRNITHWHYTNWKDFSATSVNELSLLINTINEEGYEGPLVTHCSAGVGRAGTFIATHSLLDDIEKNPNDPISISERVLHLRLQRFGMVQRLGQYKCIFDTIKKNQEIIEEE